jgi:uncharacterized protein (TIGR02145 family)
LFKFPIYILFVFSIQPFHNPPETLQPCLQVFHDFYGQHIRIREVIQVSEALVFGGSEVAGHQLQETGFTHWVKSDTAVTNSSGFTALAGGFRVGSPNPIHYFYELGYGAHFWSSSTETQWSDDDDPIGWGMTYLGQFGYGTGEFGGGSYGHSKRDGLSVRCVKD